MNPLGHTRATRQPTHLLHTPDTFVRTPLPGLIGGEAIIHVEPALGARFLWYTAELAPKGKLLPAASQRFVFLLEGEAHLTGPSLDQAVCAGAFAYLPATQSATLIATSAVRCVVIEKTYQPAAGVAAPTAFVGHEDNVTPQPLGGDRDLMVRSLLPADFAFDFAVNTMTYAPGAQLAQVEVHVMEHGLLMLEGGGIYRLGDDWYPVATGDFIWMGAFCPQWFGALGKVPAKYLIYKDFNRSPAL